FMSSWLSANKFNLFKPMVKPTGQNTNPVVKPHPHAFGNRYICHMQFYDIPGQEFIKSHLRQSAASGRIAHAQLFVGPEGSGMLPMAIAYAQYILCANMGSENSGGAEACNLKFQNLSHPD